jgi:hypothetical protein
MMKEMPQLAQQLSKIIDRQMPGRKNTTWGRLAVKTLDAPPSFVPTKQGKLTVFDVNPLEVARQLTLIEYELYHKIQVLEM